MQRISLFLFILFTLIPLEAEKIHSFFNVTKEDLKQLVAHEKPEIQKAILSEPWKFMNYMNQLLNLPEDQLRLVDKNNPLPADYVPENLVNLTEYNLNTRYETMLFAQKAVKDFQRMAEDALKEGADLFIASTYRSYSEQFKIHKNMSRIHGKEKAETIVAIPGCSQHQLGTGVDFGPINHSFYHTKEGQWMEKNAWKYGFSLSYPKGFESVTTYIWEPWHYRYLGVIPCLIQKKYFLDVQQYFLEFWKRNRIFFKQNRIQ